jgi:hypothetical protein
VAVSEHVPAATKVTTRPLTVHADVEFEVSVTGRFELAEAVTVNGDWSIVEFGGLGNVIVWATGAAGTTALDGAEAEPVPISLVAVTVNV